jgi:hypothetical protein
MAAPGPLGREAFPEVTAAALWPRPAADAYHAAPVDPEVVLAKARELAYGHGTAAGQGAGAGGQVTGAGGQVTGAGGQVTGAGGQVTGAGGQVTGAGGQETGAGAQVAAAGAQVAAAGAEVAGGHGAGRSDAGFGGGDVDRVALLIAEAGGDRAAVEAARDRVAAHLHRAVDDYEATATLQLLNRALSRMPRVDPLDWRVRWHQRFRKP